MPKIKFVPKRWLFVFMVTVCLSCSVSEQQTDKSNLSFVDPMIGTDGTGHTFPGATTPFGMVQLSPSNDNREWNWCSGYHYVDSVLKGFAHNHISGAGLGALGDILVMPTSGELNIAPGTEKDPDGGYRSRFSHDREWTSPGYYSVDLLDYDINVELTATPRVGFHRYTFARAGQSNIIIDPTHSIRERVFETEIEFTSDTEIRGFKRSAGAAGHRTVYFYAKLSKPFQEYGTSVDELVKQRKTKSNAQRTTGYIQYTVEEGEQIELALALSYVSYEGAKLNYEAEALNKDFAKVKGEAEQLWNDQLSKVSVNGSDADKRTFYTALYHTMISPNLISDIDGKYVVESKTYTSDIPQYSNYSTWDTYRAVHPLFTIMEQDKNVEFINSLASRHSQLGLILPNWEALGFDNFTMIGYSPVSPIAEGILKEMDGIDIQAAYGAMKAAAFDTTKHSRNYDKNGKEEYISQGYISAEIRCSISKTVENNYYDWAISKVAEKLGNKDDWLNFYNRSIGYRNLYNMEKGYIWPKLSNGEWVDMNLTNWDEGLVRNYVSGNIWGYSAYPPHDIDYLINQKGGSENFIAWLDAVFSDTTRIDGGQHVDISGFIGKYGHGDEPSHHMPYLYSLAGDLSKTQQIVAEIRENMYNDSPNGYVNNEDLGQMSAWYVFSTLGFYPVNPASTEYVVGVPAFDDIQVNLENGNVIRIEMDRGASSGQPQVYWNDEMLKGNAITHSLLMQGGVLRFK